MYHLSDFTTTDMKKLYTLLLSLASLTAAHAQQRLVGGDLSLLPRYEQYNTPYYDAQGHTITDVISYLKETCQWNAIRVRLFVNPTDTKQEGVIQDLAYVKDFGQRIKEAGLKFMLDFHYSDTWADPVNQKLPAAWSDCKTAEQKASRVYEYTKECLESLTEVGATPDYVQVGNEISYGIVGIQVHPYAYNGDDWAGFRQVLTEGCRAVRECCPDAQIVIHTERAAKASDTKYFYQQLESLDYDIIGLSYYPIWHAPLSTLRGTLSSLATYFPTKQVQIVETAYNYQYWPSSGVNYDTRGTWPCSAEGQQHFAQDLVSELLDHDNVTGLYWWFPEENGNGGPSWNASTIVIKDWLNRGLWDNSSHKALPALYELKAFRAGDEAIHDVPVDASSQSGIYRLDGTRLQTEWQALPHGTYIINGQKRQK